jgi:hypothetical protein
LKLSFEIWQRKNQKNIHFLHFEKQFAIWRKIEPKKKKEKKTLLLTLFFNVFGGCWGQGFFLEIFLCSIIQGQFKERFSINWQQHLKKNCPNNIFKSDEILPSN